MRAVRIACIAAVMRHVQHLPDPSLDAYSVRVHGLPPWPRQVKVTIRSLASETRTRYQKFEVKLVETAAAAELHVIYHPPRIQVVSRATKPELWHCRSLNTRRPVCGCCGRPGVPHTGR